VHYSYGDVRASYGGAKAEQERHDLMFRFFARPLSFPVAWVALGAGLSPNDVTWLSLVMNLAGLAMMATGRAGVMAWGVGLTLLSLVFDAADGNMARTARRFSPVGEWLEGVGAYLLAGFFRLAGGVGAWRAAVRGAPVTSWPSSPSDAGVLIVLGAVGAITITLTILIGSKFTAVFKNVDRETVVARQGRGWYGKLFTIGRNFSFVSGLVLPMTLAGILMRRYELVLGFFALLNSGILGTVLLRCLWTAHRGAADAPAT